MASADLPSKSFPMQVVLRAGWEYRSGGPSTDSVVHIRPSIGPRRMSLCRRCWGRAASQAFSAEHPLYRYLCQPCREHMSEQAHEMGRLLGMTRIQVLSAVLPLAPYLRLEVGE